MRYEVRLTPRARRGAVAAAEYIATATSPAAALRWQAGFEGALATLREFPARCGFAREQGGRARTVRQLIYTSYRVLFTIRGRVVIVIHVRHAARADLPGGPEPVEN